MKVTYVGPYQDGVEVPLPSGAFKHAPHGEPIDVPAETAKGLLVQEDIWTEPSTKKTAKGAK